MKRYNRFTLEIDASSHERQVGSLPDRAIVVCDQWLGSNGYAGMKALRRAGWSVHVASEWEYVPVRWRQLIPRTIGKLLRGMGVREFNSRVLQLATQVHPAIFLAFKGRFVTGKTVRTLRAAGIRCYCFYPDVSVHTHGPYLPAALREYDVVLTTKSFGVDDMTSLGVRNVHVLWHAYDPDLHRPVRLTPNDRQRYSCDASFIGTWSPKKEATLRALMQQRPSLHLRIWGAQWDRCTSPELQQAIEGYAIEGEEYVRAIAATKVNLGILSEQRSGASDGDQITSRTFHIPAAGGFMVHERTTELLELFTENVNVVCYSEASELASTVDRYLDDEAGRLRIAEAGRCLVEDGHSWDHRIRELLAVHGPVTR